MAAISCIMSDLSKSFRSSNIARMASSDPRSAKGREVELLVRCSSYFSFGCGPQHCLFFQVPNASWRNAGSYWIEQYIGFLAEGQGILWLFKCSIDILFSTPGQPTSADPNGATQPRRQPLASQPWLGQCWRARWSTKVSPEYTPLIVKSNKDVWGRSFIWSLFCELHCYFSTNPEWLLWHQVYSCCNGMDLILKSLKRYRYCVIVKLPPMPQGSRRRSVVRRWDLSQPTFSSNWSPTRWETHLKPRTMGWTNVEDIFGDVDGMIREQRGWLTEEVIHQYCCVLFL